MPTTASRNEYLPGVLNCFFGQTYPAKELVVVSEDHIQLPSDSSIHFVSCKPGISIGEKRNIACRHATGEYICHIDSDDWSAPGRIAAQLKTLTNWEVSVTGYHSMVFFDVGTNRAYKYTNDDRQYALGTSLFYQLGYWRSHHFTHVNVGEDTAWVHQIQQNQIISFDAGLMMVARDHTTNSSPRDYSRSDYWHEVSPTAVSLLLDAT